MLFVRFREDEPQLREFIDVLSDQLVNYVIPLAKRKAANAAGAQSSTGADTALHTRLQREATNLLIRYQEENKARYGEVGELISYAVAVRFLDAPQIGSKMALKTSSQMPVHGVDGLHIRLEDDGTATLFLLESKLSPSSSDATREFCDSASKYQKDASARKNELRIITDLSNLDSLPEPLRSEIKDYFDPYAESGASLKRRERHVGSLTFSESSYAQRIPVEQGQSISAHEDHFSSLYAEKSEQISKLLAKQALAKGLDLAKCEVFLIAVPDINGLKTAFAEANSGHIR
ncbi:hypothetical protein ASD72_16225 [Pseudoxanthomonas sp. Root630]|nr:hypothetical protein ASD72_16225 [Pseudoxanthomonas sp. Root630]